MRIKRTLFFSLILFLIIFSISFASADELTTTDNTNELSELSVSNDISIDESLNDVNLDSIQNQKTKVRKANIQLENLYSTIRLANQQREWFEDGYTKYLKAQNKNE